MNEQIIKLRNLLGNKNSNKTNNSLYSELRQFQIDNGLLLPADLIEYYECMEDAVDKLDMDLFEFYSFKQFKSITTELVFWRGVPDYGNIINTLGESQNCFVFAEYMAHLFVYAIRLYKEPVEISEIYLICGDKYKVVGHSFSEFLKLYFEGSPELTNI